MAQIRDDWTMPPELNQPRPRLVQSSGIRERWLVIWALLLILLLLMPLFAAFGRSLQEERLKKEGRLTTAVVTQLYTTVRRSETDYYVGYEYQYGTSGDSLNGKTGVSESQYNALHVGTSVPAVYQISEPENSDLQMVLATTWARPWRRFAEIAALFIGIFGSAWLIWLVLLQRKYLADRHLLKYGTAVAAQIVGEIETRSRFGRSVTVLFQFHNDTGRLIDGRQSGMPAKTGTGSATLARLDAAIRAKPTALFDPEKPSKSMLYPSLMVRCRAPGKQ